MGTLSKHTQRTLLNDYTFSFDKQWFQITKNQPINVYPKNKVIVEERTNNAIHIKLRGKYLNYKTLPARPPKQKNNDWVIPKTQEEINQRLINRLITTHGDEE